MYPEADVADLPKSGSPPGQPFDVLIVGAGLSGIGAARHLQLRCPGYRFVILEAREVIGGTWDLFRYPGIRSDSDMYTLGYGFKPWKQAAAIADGPSILQYIRETAAEHDITRHIRFGHSVRAASWSSREACWTVEAAVGEAATGTLLKARFVYFCSGYYNYASGYRPTFSGESAFGGTIVHPQFWPEGLDYSGKRIVVIGSGATAVTLVPEMAARAAHVTMLQRSPTYVISRPSEDSIAQGLQRILPSRIAYGLARWKNVLVGRFFYRMARKHPAAVKQRIARLAQQALGPNYDVTTHFTPRYDPWDQRICVAPDGDLFRAISGGQASVVTDTIDRFTAGGIRLASGRELAADIIVVATGLEIKLLGGASLTVDGRPVELGQQLSYKGMMLSDVPNLAWAFGYTNASWTLKVDLTSHYLCRLLRYLDRHGYVAAFPRRDPAMGTEAFVGFTSSYVTRALALMPKQGSREPWRVHHDYVADLREIRWGRIADGVMAFQRKTAS